MPKFGSRWKLAFGRGGYGEDGALYVELRDERTGSRRKPSVFRRRQDGIRRRAKDMRWYDCRCDKSDGAQPADTTT